MERKGEDGLHEASEGPLHQGRRHDRTHHGAPVDQPERSRLGRADDPVLHQPRRQEPAGIAETGAREGQEAPAGAEQEGQGSEAFEAIRRAETILLSTRRLLQFWTFECRGPGVLRIRTTAGAGRATVRGEGGVTMIDGTQRVEFSDVDVLASTDFVMRCRVAGKVVGVPALKTLPGTDVSRRGDRGNLVLPLELAQKLGLT